MAVCNRNPFTIQKISPQAGIELSPLSSRPALIPLSYQGAKVFQRIHNL